MKCGFYMSNEEISVWVLYLRWYSSRLFLDYVYSAYVSKSKCEKKEKKKNTVTTFGTLHLLHHFKSRWTKYIPVHSLLISSSGKPLRANIFVSESPTWSNNGLCSCNSATTDNRTHGFTHVNRQCVPVCVCLHTSASACVTQLVMCTGQTAQTACALMLGLTVGWGWWSVCFFCWLVCLFFFQNWRLCHIGIHVAPDSPMKMKPAPSSM